MKAQEFIDLLFQDDKYRDEPMEVHEAPRLYRLYGIPVSAGTGNFLDDSGYDMIKAPSYVPDAVDFALRVSGDSMEPLFQDEQVIWVKEQEILKNSEIGVIIYYGDVYCKECTLPMIRRI